MKICAIVPTHNHHRVLGAVVARLRDVGLPVFVIDDGSADPTRAVVAALANPASVVVRRLEPNQGKGGAVIAGFRLAAAAGFTHAVQVDADGQHDLDVLPGMLALAKQRPDAVICGHPVYDSSVPRNRELGHQFTNFWIRLETLSSQITDGMCGFRVYPLAAVTALLAAAPLGRRMDFDIDILVRLFWCGVDVQMTPVRVIYPPGNISNFAGFGDNCRITWMHARLVFGMLARLPQLLRRRNNAAPTPSRPTHWAGLSERGAYWGLRFCAAAYRVLGRGGCLAVLAPIVLVFYLLGGEQRRASRVFLARALGYQAGWRDGYRHFFSFAARTLDTFIAWTGGLTFDTVIPDDPAALEALAADPRGALFVVAHMGALDLSRAVLDDRTRERLTLLVHTRHAANYNRVLREFRPAAALNLIQVAEIGPETAIMLKDRIENGAWVVIAGDRTPVGGTGRAAAARFLGHHARFSHGPWVLAALLDCPVYLMFCLREGDRYRLTLEPFADRIDLPRADRYGALNAYAARFAGRLESYARRAPFQWYNFFDFWAQ